MLSSPRAACRVRAFDLIINLGVHAHLLEPMVNDDKSAIEEEYAQELLLNSEDQFTMQGIRKIDSAKKLGTSSAIDKFESWILNILYEILLLLVQVQAVFELNIVCFGCFDLMNVPSMWHFLIKKKRKITITMLLYLSLVFFMV